MSDLYDFYVDNDCDYPPDEQPETLKAMHERLQREIKAEHAAQSSKENTDLLLDALGLKS